MISTELSTCPAEGRLIALDPGTRRIGLAISDPAQLITSPLKTITRGSWKQLLADIKECVSEFDAVALVIGLPFAFEGDEPAMAEDARDMVRKFSLSLDIPVFVQDERVTSYEARRRVWDRKVKPGREKEHVDAEAAAIILSDFISRVDSARKL